ncbi:hypothetical protein DPM19_19510 [Actinomadura craniellae]|uniref:Phosphotransacetylase n=1 Tax=Actinomadura craniellae TaxID=2231787 RepID=A0A365H2F7_9ACTN|nr:DUF6758 family protein [Actinomadura craniellae]RAY13280.1 hypothetical protein DPM19_19510 [Actinomadura craniellae]
MKAEPRCPRCGGQVNAPNPWSSDWTCSVHGAVLPWQPVRSASAAGLAAVLRDARVPVWLPWPLPAGWLVTGFVHAGDGRTGGRACGVALSGPRLAGGPADILLIAEEMGIGLGAHFAGLPGADPGDGCGRGVPHAKVDVRGHPVPMWALRAPPDRAAYAGEAMGNWLWAVFWPADAGMLVLEPAGLIDLREPGMDLDLPFGALSPRLDQ